jgi:hypothetical protein
MTVFHILYSATYPVLLTKLLRSLRERMIRCRRAKGGILVVVIVVATMSVRTLELKADDELRAVIPIYYSSNWKACADAVLNDLGVRLYLEPVSTNSLSPSISAYLVSGNQLDMAMVGKTYADELMAEGSLLELHGYADRISAPYIVDQPQYSLAGHMIRDTSIAGILLPWAPKWVVVVFAQGGDVEFPKKGNVELVIDVLNHGCFQRTPTWYATSSITMFVDSLGREVTSYTTSDLVYVKVIDPSMAGRPFLTGLEIDGDMYDLDPLAGAQNDTFITDGLDLGLSVGDTLSATYTDPTDTDVSSDTIQIVATPPAPAPVLTFQGHVYEGELGSTSRPMQGVLVWLYGANNVYPAEGTQIDFNYTDHSGGYSLTGRTGFEVYSIREHDPGGHESTGARSASGRVWESNWIEFIAPSGDDNLSGNDFWDREYGPDLAVAELRLDPQDPSIGAEVYVLAEVVNRGNAPAEEPSVRFSVNGQELPRQTAGPLQAGAAQQVEAPWTPESPGEHTVRVAVDDDEQIAELDEKNNTASRTVFVQASDLSVHWIRFEPEEPVTGDDVLLSTEIFNDGGSTARGVEILVRVDGRKLDQTNVDLASGSAITFEARWQAPHPGTFAFSVEADPDDQIAETDEHNNLELARLIVPGPDLAVVCTSPGIVSSDGTLVIPVTVSNVGGGPSSEADIQTVDHFTGARAFLRSHRSGWPSQAFHVPPLEPGGQCMVDVRLDTPYEQRGRWHVFRIQLSPASEDSNPDNDQCETDPIYVPHLPPDLAVADVTGKSVENSRKLLITAIVENRGEGPAERTTIYAEKEGTDWRSDDRRIPALGRGEEETVTMQLDIPDEQRGVEHVITVRLAPVEGDDDPENDRRDTAPIGIPLLPPDLKIVRATPTLSETHRAVVVAVSVRNVGQSLSSETVIQAFEHLPMLQRALGRQPDWVSELVRVPELPSDGETEIKIMLPILDEHRGSEHAFTVRLESLQDDPNRENDRRDTAPIYVPLPPDLAVIDPVGKYVAEKRTLRIAASVQNFGEQSAPATSVYAVEEDTHWRSDDWVVPTLAPGDATTIEMELGVLREHRGSAHTFRIQLVPIDEDQDRSNDAHDTQPIYVPQPPDLAVTEARVELIDDDATLLATATVTNRGEETASETRTNTAEVGDTAGWSSEGDSVPALAVGKSFPIETRLDIPDAKRGSRRVFIVRLDSVESDPDPSNDKCKTDSIYIPRLPDVAVLEANCALGDRKQVVRVTVIVENLGEEPVIGAKVVALEEATDWRSEDHLLPRLEPKRQSAVDIVLPIRDTQRGSEHTFTVQLGAVAEDRNPANDKIQAQAIFIPPKGLPYWAWGLVAGFGAVGCAVGPLYVRHSIKVRHHNECQEHAKEHDPPETCREGASYCQWTELKAEPEHWKVDKLIACLKSGETQQEQSESRQIKGTITKRLNRAISAGREGVTPEELAVQLKRVPRLLLQQITRWLVSEEEKRCASVTAHLVDGRIEGQFKLYECQQDGESSLWEERDTWKGKIVAKRRELVTEVRASDLGDRAKAERMESELRQCLVSFVQRVSALPMHVRDAKIGIERET